MRTWLPLLALTALACSSSGTWRRVETPHFLLRTDLGASDAKHAGAALETTRDALRLTGARERLAAARSK